MGDEFWIEQTEKKLGFPLPNSYKEMLVNYELILKLLLRPNIKSLLIVIFIILIR